MRKLILIFIVLWAANASGQGFVERHIKGTENVETNLHFIYQNTYIPVLDITYHEFSADSLTWRKQYQDGDCYVRFNNYTNNDANPYTGLQGYHPDSTWWVFNFCTCNGAIPDEIGGIDTMFVYYYQSDTVYSIDTVVVQNGAVDINIPYPDTISGSSTNFQDTTRHTHELYVFIGDNEDVDTTGVQNGYVLKWNSTTELWQPYPDLTGGGGGSSLDVSENDGNPDVSNVNKIFVDNDHLTDLGAGQVRLDLSIDPIDGENDFYRTGKVRVGSGDTFLSFSSALPDTNYVVTNAYALLDVQKTRQDLKYDSLTVNGFKVLSVIDSAYVHYLAIRATDSLLLALDGVGRVYASGSDVTLGYLSQKTDDSTITVLNNRLTVLADSLTIAHDSLYNLEWSNADHVIDTLIAMSGNGLDSTGFVDFDITASVAHKAGRLHWNDEDGTLDLGMNGDTVKLQLGLELLMYGKNSYGAQIDNGKVVFIDGGQGANPTITLADKDSTNLNRTIAVATEDIPTNNFGYATSFGVVRNVNTSAFSDGDELWLGDSGDFTNVEPARPNKKVFIGTVLNSGVNGDIYVRIKVYTDIHEMPSVNDTVPTTDGAFLVYDADSSYYSANYNITDYVAKADTTDISETTYGISRIATLVEALTGENDETQITPLKLIDVLEVFVPQDSINAHVNGTVDGVNDTFTTNKDFVPNTTQLIVNGVVQILGTHYNEAGLDSVVFEPSYIPTTGEILRINYQY